LIVERASPVIFETTALWDDVIFSMKARLARHILLIEAFENPLRLRFDLVGDDITQRYGAATIGKFSDEFDHHPSIDELTSQCRATVERRPNMPRTGARTAARAAGLISCDLPRLRVADWLGLPDSGSVFSH
jgi:hypothetical protein